MTKLADITEMEDLLEGLVTIPTVPTTLGEINRILEDPESSAKDAADVVAKDPAVAAKTLRLVNSAYYALQSPVSSIPFAVSIVGLKVLKNLVIQATVLESFGDLDGVGGISGDWLWDHCYKTAVAAGEIAKRVGKAAQMLPEDAYTCGLIHDVGRIIMGESMGPRYARAMLRAKKSEQEIHLVERELFQFDHAMVGAYLSEQWRLSPRLSKSILHHHDPEALAQDEVEEDRLLGHLLAAANAMAHTAKEGRKPYPVEDDFRPSLAALGLEEAEEIEEILEKVQVTVRET